MSIADPETVDAAIARIQAKGEAPRFDREAYRWVFVTIDHLTKGKRVRHLEGAEAVFLLAEASVDHFGLAAPMVWTEWGIAPIRDSVIVGAHFARLVYRLIEVDVLQAGPADTEHGLADAGELFLLHLNSAATRHRRGLKFA